MSACVLVNTLFSTCPEFLRQILVLVNFVVCFRCSVLTRPSIIKWSLLLLAKVSKTTTI